MDTLRFGDFNGDGRTDIFRRDGNGQWWIVSPGVDETWKDLASSQLPLSALRFGDFNNDRITDVIAVVGGRWSVSFGGTTSWQPFNSTLGSSLASVVIADVNQNGRDDIVRFRTTRIPGLKGVRNHKWQIDVEVSWDGRSVWSPLHQFVQDTGTADTIRPVILPTALGGRFRGTASKELFEIDGVDRIGRVFDMPSFRLIDYGRYAF
jgi:hypothetical protein